MSVQGTSISISGELNSPTSHSHPHPHPHPHHGHGLTGLTGLGQQGEGHLPLAASPLGAASVSPGGQSQEHGEGQNGQTGEQDDEEPLYVNAKQYHRIVKRRAARARLEELHRLSSERKVSSFNRLLEVFLAFLRLVQPRWYRLCIDEELLTYFLSIFSILLHFAHAYLVNGSLSDNTLLLLPCPDIALPPRIPAQTRSPTSPRSRRPLPHRRRARTTQAQRAPSNFI